jgi:hypothetical protein
MGAKASVQGAVIGFFIGLFGPRLYAETNTPDKK